MVKHIIIKQFDRHDFSEIARYFLYKNAKEYLDELLDSCADDTIDALNLGENTEFAVNNVSDEYYPFRTDYWMYHKKILNPSSLRYVKYEFTFFNDQPKVYYGTGYFANLSNTRYFVNPSGWVYPTEAPLIRWYDRKHGKWISRLKRRYSSRGHEKYKKFVDGEIDKFRQRILDDL